MDEARRKEYLDAMGVDVWVRRAAPLPAMAQNTAQADAEVVPAQTVLPDPSPPLADTAAWDALVAQVRQCTECELHKRRTQTVFGVGDRQARWLIIGEAPGADEDRQGEPFVGRAGKLLTSMLYAMGLRREEVYITNVVKCRPPNNRDPRPEEMACCADYLRRQISLIDPAIILVVGRIAAQNLLNTTTPIGRLRGETYRYADTDIPLIVTYHPAYLLRSPLEKRKAWQDLQYAMSVCRQREIVTFA